MCANALEAGAKGYILKNAMDIDLANAINRWLRARE